jgi:hypothetical protein
MAKKPTINRDEIAPVNTNPFAPTQPAQPLPEGNADRRKVLPKDKVRAVSVALTEAEYAEFDRIASETSPLPATRMAVMNHALRYFIAEYRAGRIKLETFAEHGRVRIKE